MVHIYVQVALYVSLHFHSHIYICLNNVLYKYHNWKAARTNRATSVILQRAPQDVLYSVPREKVEAELVD